MDGESARSRLLWMGARIRAHALAERPAHLEGALLLELRVEAAAPGPGAADAGPVRGPAAEEGGGLQDGEDQAAARALDPLGQADEAQAEVLLAVQPAGHDAAYAGVERSRRGEEEEVEAEEVGEGFLCHVDPKDLEVVKWRNISMELRKDDTMGHCNSC